MIKRYPNVNETFELKIDGDNPDFQSMSMVMKCCHRPHNWSHNGKKIIAGEVISNFKLVQVDNCSNVFDLIQKLSVCGEIPWGQWMMAFKACYPEHDRNGPVGLIDDSWRNLEGSFCFPAIDSHGDLYFRIFNNHGFDRFWRWIVFAK